jgi:excisionase family DNA binding protein
MAQDSVYCWIEGRGLPAHKIGQLWKFKLSQVDAWVRAYKVTRDDAEFVLDDLNGVRDTGEKASGEYRTRRVILDIYDAMAEAVRGKAYKTRLDPPPADPRVARPDPRGGKR